MTVMSVGIPTHTSTELVWPPTSIDTLIKILIHDLNADSPGQQTETFVFPLILKL